MSLKSMHEARRSSEEPSFNSPMELLRQQRERITELEQQLSEAKRIGNENLASATAAAEKRIAELQYELQKRQQSEQLLSEQLETQLKLNASLNNSDLQLKEAERMRRKAWNAEEAANEKAAAAMAYKREAEQAKREAEQAKREANRLAEERAKEIEASVRRRVHISELYYRGWLSAAMGYGILITAFTAIRSKAFASDFKAFFGAVWCFISLVWEKLLLGASVASGAANNDILRWVILVLVVGLALAAVAGGLIWLLPIVVDFYRYAGVGFDQEKSFADNITLAELLVSLAVLVFFAEPIRELLPINLVLLFVLAHAAFIAIRWLILRRSRVY